MMESEVTRPTALFTVRVLFNEHSDPRQSQKINGEKYNPPTEKEVMESECRPKQTIFLFLNP